VAVLSVLIAAAWTPFTARAGMELTLERVGHWGGCSRDVQVVGDRAYVAIGPRVVVLDVSSPDAPTFLGQSEPLPNVVMYLDIEGPFAYAITYRDGLHVLDVSDPERITVLGSNTPGLRYYGMVAQNAYVYACGPGATLDTYDAHDPANPELVDSTPTSLPAVGMCATNGYLYVRVHYCLDIFSLSDPGHPRLIHTMPTRYTDAEHDGTWLYGLTTDHLDIWDVSDPNQPTLAGTCSAEDDPWCDSVTVSEGYAYVAEYSRIHIMDVRAPAGCVYHGWVPVGGMVHAVDANDGVLLAANWYYGLATFDISVPESPVEIGHYDNAVHAAAIGIHKGYAYLTGYRDEVQIIDISSPENPTRHAQQALGLSRMHIVDDIAYVATWRPFDLQALDIARFNEENGLDFISHTPLPHGPHDVSVDGQFAYVTVFDTGLVVIDVSTLEAPVIRGTCPLNTQRVAARYPYAYVAGGSAEVWYVVDVSDPDNPFHVRTLDSDGPAESILVEDDRLYLGRASGFDIYSLTEPDDPALLGQFSQAGLGYITCMVYRDDRLYISPGLSVVDVSNPASPRLLGTNIYGSRLAEDIELQGRYVYAAHNSSGLSVFEIRLVADFDDDGDVDESDLMEFLDHYGACAGDADYSESADFDGDGCIDLSDLAEFLSLFGNQR